MAGITKQLLSAKLRASIEEDAIEDDFPSEDDIPFTQKDKSNKENENSPQLMASPRSKMRIPFETAGIKVENVADDGDLDQNNNSQPATPTKPMEDNEAPLTPTANLKMLFSAVSPEIRKMQSKLKEESQKVNKKYIIEDNDFDSEILCSSQESDSGKTTGSRKEKSLGLLCQKFLQKYPEYPEATDNFEICLDEVAKELAVERRRIYDIVNVLESVEIVSRVAKNRYAWHGKTNLVTTLAKLKALAETEGFAEQMDKLKELELSRDLQEGEAGPMLKLPADANEKGVRKDKSLGIMSQKFLMLFLVSKPKTVNLDLSAKILIGDPLIDRTESSKFKTKIRRLYDIANILTSLDLIRKVHVTEVRGRKPAFRYIGPDVDNVGDFGLCCSDGCHRPSSRHSMLDCVKNSSVASLVNLYRPIQPIPYNNSVTATLAEVMSKVSKLKQDTDGNGLRRFSRHASFDQICQVAEKERSKLYGGCSSEPSSPVKKLIFDESLEGPQPKPEMKKSQSIPAMTKKPYVIVQDMHLTIIPDQADKNKSSIKTTPSQQPFSFGKSPGIPSTLILQSKGSNVMENKKQPTMIPLTRDQIDAVLRSLKVPVSNDKDSSRVDASTQSSPETPTTRRSLAANTTLEARSTSPDCTLATLNETTPQAPPDRRGVKRTFVTVKSSNAADKRIRLAIPTPPSTEEESGASSSDSFSLTPDSEVNTITRGAKRKATADRRALHLAPEFRNSPPTLSLPRKQPTPDVLKKITASELELAAPLADDEESPCSKLSPQNRCRIPQAILSPMQCVTIQLPSQSSVAMFHGQDRIGGKILPHSPPMQAFTHPQSLQIVNGMPVTPSGQQVSFMMPVAFSPPLTPSSPTVFTLPTSQHAQQNIAFTSVHLMQPPNVKVNPSLVTSSCAPSPIQKLPRPMEAVRMIIPSEQPISSMESFNQVKAGSLFAPIRVTHDPKSAIRKLSLSELY